ncbi:WD40/YVTN/BNR-like repeat-containing protein [Clostridium sp.]|uniref:WD40/YVTN/BNR-like repeat-containing protein n=1 Tax=Clostridium sp. TaxID=1506 RepID=UPI002FC6D46E
MSLKNKIIICISIILVIFCVGSGIYIYKFKSSYIAADHPVIKYEDSTKLQNIGEPMLSKYLERYMFETGMENASEKIEYVTVKSSILTAGDNNTFVVSVIFDIGPHKKGDFSDWGDIDSEGIVHCNWRLVIRNLNNGEYRLLDVLKDNINKEESNKENNSNIKTAVLDKKYKIEGDNVYITYDNGASWVKVPVPFSSLNINYAGIKDSDSLEDGSYFISNNMSAFIYGNGTAYISNNKGKSWSSVNLLDNPNKEAPNDIDTNISGQFIGFTNDGFGYALICTDKTMSFELINVYTSNDNGKSFEYKGVVKKDGSSIATGVSFSSSKIGFITTKGNGILMTKDGGDTWDKIELKMPDKLKAIYDDPKAPIFTGNNGELYVGQGDDGDYGAGENQLCKFVTEDGGLTWKYDGEVIK